MKNPLTPAGIVPATFRFVAQHLKHCATGVPTTSVYRRNNITKKVHLIYSATCFDFSIYRHGGQNIEIAGKFPSTQHNRPTIKSM